MDFVQILTKITTSHQSDSDLMDAFEVFDREEKGFFRLHELEEALNEMPGSELMTENELADILQLADPDGDGHVSFEGLCEVNLDPDMRRKCSPPPPITNPSELLVEVCYRVLDVLTEMDLEFSKLGRGWQWEIPGEGRPNEDGTHYYSIKSGVGSRKVGLSCLYIKKGRDLPHSRIFATDDIS